MDTTGVQRGLVGPIITRFEQRGFKLVAIKLVTPGKEHLEKHCQFLLPRSEIAERNTKSSPLPTDADLAGKPFFPGLIQCNQTPARQTMFYFCFPDDRARHELGPNLCHGLGGP